MWQRREVFNTYTEMNNLSSRLQGYSVEEVAGMFETSERTIYRRMDQFRDTQGREGLGPVFRDGKIVRIPEESIREWVRRGTGY